MHKRMRLPITINVAQSTEGSEPGNPDLVICFWFVGYSSLITITIRCELSVIRKLLHDV